MLLVGLAGQAQCNLGFCHYRGIGTPEDNEQAVKWFTQAAGAGQARAQQLLGECYENGYGVEMDLEKAVELYRKSHEQHYPAGTCSLGGC